MNCLSLTSPIGKFSIYNKTFTESLNNCVLYGKKQQNRNLIQRILAFFYMPLYSFYTL